MTTVDLNRVQDMNADISAQVDDMFAYQPWDDAQITAGVAVRKALAEAFKVILMAAPPCPDRTVALRKLRDARMDVNSAIAHKGKY